MKGLQRALRTVTQFQSIHQCLSHSHFFPREQETMSAVSFNSLTNMQTPTAQQKTLRILTCLRIIVGVIPFRTMRTGLHPT